MRFVLKKSTLGEFNRGLCGSRNNSRYTGQTVCWVVVDTVELYTKAGCRTEDPMEIIAVNRKFVAEAMVKFCNDTDYNNIGCVGMLFLQYCRDNEMWEMIDAYKEV